jgi:hypothetical protein
MSDEAVDREIGRLKRMPRQVMNSYGFPVSMFKVFDMNAKKFSQGFYPTLPLSAFKIT